MTILETHQNNLEYIQSTVYPWYYIYTNLSGVSACGIIISRDDVPNTLYIDKHRHKNKYRLRKFYAIKIKNEIRKDFAKLKTHIKIKHCNISEYLWGPGIKKLVIEVPSSVFSLLNQFIIYYSENINTEILINRVLNGFDIIK